jgi:hypothetical protein
MKTISTDVLFHAKCTVVAAMLMSAATAAPAQAAITFDAHPNFGGTNYYESGMRLHVVNPVSNYGMGVVGPVGPGSTIPYNSTPYMGYVGQTANDFVAFDLTDASAFGLTSVQLADPNSPSYSLLPMAFVGFKVNGSTVTNTFTTPGAGADHLLSYQFGSDFASGLTSVEILAPRWAMDNLVFTVPEPSTLSVLGLGACVVVGRWFLRRRL